MKRCLPGPFVCTANGRTPTLNVLVAAKLAVLHFSLVNNALFNFSRG